MKGCVIMDMEQIKEISKGITDESMIQFKSGQIYKGAENVTTIIAMCCEQYNESYLQTIDAANIRNKLTQGCLLGSGIILGGCITYKLIKKIEDKIKHKD